LVKELTTYQQLTQIKAWLGGCSQLWHQVSLESKIILRFLMIGGIKIILLGIDTILRCIGIALLQLLGITLRVDS
jgi:hypothetical protein